MGIPSLFAYYYRKYRKENELMISIEELNRIGASHLFFDFNSLIHPCAHQILLANADRYGTAGAEQTEGAERPGGTTVTEKIEDDIIENCINYTKEIVYNLTTVSCVYIVIDGVAPRSKMNQQRERRYKSYFFRELEETSGRIWDSNKITPGTHFMEKMSKRLSEWIAQEKNIKYILSDSDDPGEGEHKMMKIINHIDTRSKICIYGLDADLIMLSLMHKRSDDIILVRDVGNNGGNNGTGGNNDKLTYLNIRQLKNYIVDDILYKFGEQNTKSMSRQNIIHDYVLICFFLGNDFLDHLYPIEIKERGIDVIIRAYIKAWRGKHLVYNCSSINLVYLKDIFYQLKNHEEYYLKNFSKPATKIDLLKINEYNEREIKQVHFYNDNLTYNLTYNLVGQGDQQTSQRDPNQFKTKYHTFYDMHDIDAVCLNYIEGLYWILGYYSGHIHNNWSWYYKYHNSPLCEDLFNYLRTHPNLEIHLEADKPYTASKQLCLVLPRESICNLNQFDRIVSLFDCDSKFINDLFPTFIHVDINNKEFLWKSKILFNPIDESILDTLLTISSF
jgi:5'-3' exonuclease